MCDSDHSPPFPLRDDKLGLTRIIMGILALCLFPVPCQAMALSSNLYALVALGTGFCGWRTMEVVHHAIDSVASGTESIVDEIVTAVEDGVHLALMTGNLILGLCALQIVFLVLKKFGSGELF